MVTTNRSSLGGSGNDKIKGLLMYHKSGSEADLISQPDDNISKPVSVSIVQSLLC